MGNYYKSSLPKGLGAGSAPERVRRSDIKQRFKEKIIWHIRVLQHLKRVQRAHFSTYTKSKPRRTAAWNVSYRTTQNLPTFKFCSAFRYKTVCCKFHLNSLICTFQTTWSPFTVLQMKPDGFKWVSIWAFNILVQTWNSKWNSGGAKTRIWKN